MNLLKLFQRPSPSPISPSVGEVVNINSFIYPSGLGIIAYNPDELTRKKGGLRVYDEMRQDEQVKACLLFKKYAVLSPGWKIEPASANKKDIDNARFVEYVFGEMKGTLNAILFNVLTALDYGYSISELVWMKYVEGEYQNKFGLKAIKTKQPHYFNFDSDEFGNLREDGIILNILSGTKKLPLNKFIVFTYQKEFDNWYGTSDLRAAYRNWWSKDAIIKFWNIYLERFGQPLTRGQYSSNDSNQISTLKTILQNLQSKTSIIHRKGDFEIDFLEATRRSTGDYADALQYHNRAIARSILIPDKITEGGDTGAYAQAKVQFDSFLWIVQQLRGELEETVMQEQIIKPLIKINYGNNNYPKFRFNPITEDQKILLLQTFIDAVQKGAVLPNIEDQNKIREVLGFPLVEIKETALAEKIKAEMVNIKNNRELSHYEKKINFIQIDKELKENENKYFKEIQEILIKQKEALTSFITSKILNDSLTPSLILSLDLKYMGEIKNIIKDMFEKGYKIGVKDAKTELPKKYVIVQRQGIGLTPKKAIQYLEAKSDFSALKIKEPLLKDIKKVLLDSLRTGASVKATTTRLENAYQPYITEGEIKDGEELAPYRLESIVRTELGEAYNYGRRAVGEDPDLKDYIIGYQFSEILDSRTTEISREIDGMTIGIDSDYLDDLTYPLHWNDRGMFVFITIDDMPVEWTPDRELAKIAEWAKELKP